MTCGPSSVDGPLPLYATSPSTIYKEFHGKRWFVTAVSDWSEHGNRRQRHPKATGGPCATEAASQADGPAAAVERPVPVLHDVPAVLSVRRAGELEGGR